MAKVKGVHAVERTVEIQIEAAVLKALKDLVNYHPDVAPIQFTEAGNPYNESDDVRVPQSELDEDVEAPFFSESYLYNLLGKEDARALLGRVKRLCTALGVELHELYRDRG